MTRSEFIYEVQDLVSEHGITLAQAFHCLCLLHNIDSIISAEDALPIYQKGLIKGNKINLKVLFRDREEPEQATLNLEFTSEPKSTEDTLKVVDRLEKRIVLDKYLSDDYRGEIAQKYFKGDKNVARYFIVFKSLFPVKDKKVNAKWNKHYGYIYEGLTLWDSHVRVAKRFHELYRKKDICIFIAGAYLYTRDVVNSDEETCWITKPYKFMTNYEQWYDSAEENMIAKQEEEAEPIKEKVMGIKTI